VKIKDIKRSCRRNATTTNKTHAQTPAISLEVRK